MEERSSLLGVSLDSLIRGNEPIIRTGDLVLILGDDLRYSSVLVNAALGAHAFARLRQSTDGNEILAPNQNSAHLVPIGRIQIERPFATIKYRIFGHPRLLMRGLSGAKVELGLATMAYNLKRITNVLGATKVTEALHLAR